MTIGVLFLDSLSALSHEPPSAAWRTDGALRPPRVRPPSRMVVVTPSAAWTAEWGWSRAELSAAWLRLARAVALVVDETDEPQLDSDPDLRELADEERANWASALGNVHSVRRAGAGGVDAAIAEAVTSLAGVAEPDEAPWGDLPSVSARRPEPAGPWVRWPIEERSGVCLSRVIDLASTAVTLDPRPTLLLAPSSQRLDLVTGELVAAPDLSAVRPTWPPAGADPQSSRWMRMQELDPHRLTYRLEGAAGVAVPGTGNHPLGVAPGGAVAWAGHRCRFAWYAVVDGQLAWLCGSSHEWPLGHARKLYGYANNDPSWVHMAPEGDCALSVYQHDALLTSGVPLRWREGREGALVGERSVGSFRALLFSGQPEETGFASDPWAADEDARKAAAVVSLGPDSAQRYCVGLIDRTWRARRLAPGEVLPAGARRMVDAWEPVADPDGTLIVEDLGGPEDAWVVYDADHREVARHSGRLLAGWGRHVVLLRDGLIVRASLGESASSDLTEDVLGPAERGIDGAFPVAGSPHAVLISIDRDPSRSPRLEPRGPGAWLRFV